MHHMPTGGMQDVLQVLSQWMCFFPAYNYLLHVESDSPVQYLVTIEPLPADRD